MNSVWLLIVDRDYYDEMIPRTLGIYSSEKKARFMLKRYLRMSPEDKNNAYIQEWEVH